MVLKVKRIKEDFVLKSYPELFRAVAKIPDLNDRQRELVYGLGIEIAENSMESVSIFYTDFGDELDTEMEDLF